ncbi:hypothetical protein CALCODRAFT_506559 [Calocera cornea HHB12733]|uniref:Uncharacterized protein n=1 Tax=Calocera cornea HHB12733 TaxID=1353952 RepID=A0A165ISN9_9BASI|nr:hypothetical protein CALCODRAFT_506559 [Calocera cornea HHB12733]
MASFQALTTDFSPPRAVNNIPTILPKTNECLYATTCPNSAPFPRTQSQPFHQIQPSIHHLLTNLNWDTLSSSTLIVDNNTNAKTRHRHSRFQRLNLHFLQPITMTNNYFILPQNTPYCIDNDYKFDVIIFIVNKEEATISSIPLKKYKLFLQNS